jgi:hypothetical protein
MDEKHAERRNIQMEGKTIEVNNLYVNVTISAVQFRELKEVKRSILVFGNTL